MCGIAGILGREDPDLVRRMTDALSHRGPDGEGIWLDDGVTLGHRRLSIIDHDFGAQPMQSHDGSRCIVFNGEIYNHRSLRAQLEELGCRFASDHSDTEVLLEGHRQWGLEGLLGRLEGMFAFALWDRDARTLSIARDPWGIKPFFYACTPGGEWVFASEQKALFVHPDILPVPDLDRLKERAALEFLTGQATLFRGVHQLPPGTFVILSAGDQRGDCHVAWQPYYQVANEAFASPAEAASAIRERFVASIDEQLMADVPLGVILSGGLDSAAVAAVHQTLLADAPIQTFTIADSEDVEDFQAARRLAEHLGTTHKETFFDDDDVWTGLPKYAWHNENINYTEFFFEPLFSFMRQDVTVGLCGQGSDELWGGYERYKQPMALAKERLARIRAAAPAHAEELATTVALTHLSGSALAEWDQQGQLNNFQLRLVDRNSMAHGLEVRVPFLSRPLHAASRAAPWGWKVATPPLAPAAEAMEKWIFRKAVADVGLPKELVWRRKVPAGRATAPHAIQRFEERAAKLVGKRPLRPGFRSPAEQLVADLWHEVFVERGTWKGVTLEDLA